jgi:hypothetical protein
LELLHEGKVGQNPTLGLTSRRFKGLLTEVPLVLHYLKGMRDQDGKLGAPLWRSIRRHLDLNPDGAG